MSKYGPEITAELCSYLENGSNRTDAVTLSGISYETFMTWQREHLEFLEAIKKAEATCKQRNIGIVLKAAEKVWTAAAWYLERKFPNEFGLKMRPADDKDDEVPQRMAERAKELLDRLERKKEVTLAGSNGNGVHP